VPTDSVRPGYEFKIGLAQPSRSESGFSLQAAGSNLRKLKLEL